VKFAWIKPHADSFGVAVMYQVLQVSRQGYYAWKDRPASPAALRRQELLGQIRQIHAASDASYGSPRIHAELAERQITCCVHTVARLMRQAGIQGCAAPRFVPQTTDSNHDQPVFENILNQEFTAALPNQKWVGDITYIPTGEGWLDLAAVLDLCRRKIVGWCMAEHLRTELCTEALHRAIQSRRPSPGLLHHSDRGVPYASADYQRQLNLLGIGCSMSRVGNCYDNAVMESFWGTLKTEHVYRRKFATREDAKTSIFLWIEGWYNRRRRHSALGYKSPEAFEAALN
jgi:putative transposase